MSEIKVEPSTQGTPIEVFITFLKLGLTSFGGPVAHLGYYRKELVERQRWLSDSQYSQLLAICQFLPGPASSQLGFSMGMLRAGWLGALAAFLAFTLPSAILLIGFASVLPYLSGEIGQAAIHGLKLVACVIVADAVWGMSNKLCPDNARRSIAVFAAGILLVAGSAWLQLIVVLAGAAAGLYFCRESVVEGDCQIQVGYGKRTGLIMFALFLLLLTVLPLLAGPSGLVAMADAFYRAGALVFGGGHVVLPLLEDSVVASGWINKESFLAGYGAAQAIPGPLFTFSAYLGAIIPTEHSSWVSAFTALLFMFLPGLLLIAAALPLWQSISHNQTAANAIAGVNAAVVGLLGAALYDPILTSGISTGADFAIALIGMAMLAVWKLSPLYVVLWCVVASSVLSFI
ncbi:MAG: chromate efflux transporter [Motiliproteus sp.]|nr:chromate efflux transporter [Motiliproteus sp.]MCW9052704.1 chromate efflux transporter [Motiliproteus sp.]